MKNINLELLCSIVREARPIVFNRDLADNISEKGKNDYVTQADTSVQNFIKERLYAVCPECRFMGEESDDHSIDDNTPTFVLDPIDGTTNFIHDFRLSAISLALVLGGKTKMGVVYNPFTDEMFAAEREKGATLNGKPIHVSNVETLQGALANIGTMPYRKEISDKLFPLWREIFNTCIDIRRTGSAAIDACYIAAGRADIYFECCLGAWDVAASSLIVEEAGGRITDWNGEKIRLGSELINVAVSNGKLHTSFLDLILQHTNKP